MRLLYLTIAWLAGILFGRLLWQAGLIGCSTALWPGGALAAVTLCLLVASRRQRWVPALFIVWVCLLGAWRYQSHPLAACSGPDDVAFYNGSADKAAWVTLQGTVAGYPDARDTQTYYRLAVQQLTVGSQTRQVHGDVLVLAPRWPAFAYGDRLRLAGTLEAPPVLAGLDYPAYLAGQGIYSRVRTASVELMGSGQGQPILTQLYALRADGVALFERTLPQPTAGLASGMLLGVEGSIPRATDELFQATGTAHVIAISGSNIALFSGYLLLGLGRLLGRRRAALPAIALIAAYVVLVGEDPSAVRAGIMGGLYLGASLLGRLNFPLLSLAGASFLMTLVDPLTTFDAGFQLSVSATLGLVLFVPAWRGKWMAVCKRRLPASCVPAARFLGDLLLVTIAAQVMTLPLTVAYFGRFSPVLLLANALILPVQPAILVSGMVTLLAGAVWQPLAGLTAPVLWFFLTYTVECLKLVSRVPLASIETGPWASLPAVLYYGALAAALGWHRVAHHWPNSPAQRRVAVWALSAGLPVLLGAALLAGRPDGRLHIFYLPAEGGEAALLLTPNGRSAFVWDGRGDGTALAAAARLHLPWPATQPDLALGQPAINPWPSAEAIDPAGLRAGERIQIDEGVMLEVLDAGGEWVLGVRYGDFTTLLPAGLSRAAQTVLAASTPEQRLTLLKSPDPGTGTWPAPEFIEALAPQFVLWPQDTTYPPGTTGALAGLPGERVESKATAEVVTDGKRMWTRQLSGAGSLPGGR